MSKKFKQAFLTELKEVFRPYNSFRVLEEDKGLIHQGFVDNHTKRVFFGIEYNGSVDLTSCEFVDEYCSIKSPIIQISANKSPGNIFLFSIPIDLFNNNEFNNNDLKKSFKDEINSLYK